MGLREHLFPGHVYGVMNTLPTSRGRLAVAGLCLLVAGYTWAVQAAGEASATARTVRLKGQARISTDNKTWRALKAGDSLATGNLVQTALKAQLDISLDNPGTGTAPAFETANVVSLLEGSVLNINKLATAQTGAAKVETVELELLSGQLGGHFRKPTAGSTYEIRFPKGIVGIRGANFQLVSSGRLEVAEGSVVISMTVASGSLVTEVVTAGHQFDPVTGLVTASGPDRLPPPPKAASEEPKPAPPAPAPPDDPLREIPKRKF
jgi:hypothetical protein